MKIISYYKKIGYNIARSANGRRKPHVILCSCSHPPGERARAHVCAFCVGVFVYVNTKNSC